MFIYLRVRICVNQCLNKRVSQSMYERLYKIMYTYVSMGIRIDVIHVQMYISCAHVFMHADHDICTCVFACVHIHIYKYVLSCTCAYVCVCVQMYTCTYAWTYCMYMLQCGRIRVDVRIHVRACRYVHMTTEVYII